MISLAIAQPLEALDRLKDRDPGRRYMHHGGSRFSNRADHHKLSGPIAHDFEFKFFQ